MVKKKKKIVLCSIIAILLLMLLAVVYFFQFTPDGYRMSVPYRNSFVKISENIYVNNGYSGNTDDIIRVTDDAVTRDTEFFGEMQYAEDTIIVFVMTNNCFQSSVEIMIPKLCCFLQRKTIL